MENSGKKLVQFIQDYESILRFSRSRLLYPETIMQHVGEVGLLCLYMVDHINETAGYTVFTEEETASILRRALVHDMEEIKTGDIARPAKYSSQGLSDMIKELERHSAAEVVSEYELPTKWLHEWSIAKDGRGGLVVKVADALSVMLTCYREVHLYCNKPFQKVQDEAFAHFALLIDALREKSEQTTDEKDKELYKQLYQLIAEVQNIALEDNNGRTDDVHI